MWRGTRVMRKETGMKLVNLVRDEFSESLRQRAYREVKEVNRRRAMENFVDIFPKLTRISKAR